MNRINCQFCDHFKVCRIRFEAQKYGHYKEMMEDIIIKDFYEVIAKKCDNFQEKEDE